MVMIRWVGMHQKEFTLHAEKCNSQHPGPVTPSTTDEAPFVIKCIKFVQFAQQ